MANKKVSQLAEGDVDGDEWVLVSKPSQTVKIVAATISALGADNSFNDSANGFIAAGFVAGDQFRVQGFTGNTANNLFTARIASLSAGKLVVEAPEGNAIVDDAAGETVTITRWDSLRVPSSELGGVGGADGSIVLPVACSDEATALTAGNAKVTFHYPMTGNVTEVWAGLTTPQAANGAGGIFTVDVNNAGASILSTKITIDNTEETSLTAASAPVISNPSVTKGAKGTIDIDQIGDGSAKGLKVYIKITPP
ncbi:hypothetical protein [Caldimonas sp. KR1-144]|uniref:hypothetical protein n=1 Tax=Caldimonas sp. KR1-144 TaxID=3400911 RepID=UPI003C016358